MRKFALLLLVSICAYGQEAQVHKTPEQIAQELQVAENQFDRAKKMINPYYQGPLLTPGAGMTPPGMAGAQGYVFVNDNYAVFNKKRSSVSLPNSLINVNPALYVSTGITKTMDCVLVVQGDGNWQAGKSGSGFGDMYASVGWPILVQTVHLPAIKFNVGETFPTGNYQRLSPDLLDSTGGGSYQTQFSIGIAKLVLWTTQHPVNLRWWFGYTVPTSVDVRGFSTYGGDKTTKGTVRPGNSFSTDLGIEVAITQKWVFCTDFVYKAQNKTTFHGKTILPVGSGYGDNFSICPGFEYSWNPNLGVLAGVWFSVYGRSSPNFVSGIISISYAFP